MDVWRQKTAIVSKLRVKGERLDPVASRLHFERLFGAADFLPAGLPPQAVVCIRHLRDPSPRTLRLDQFDLRRSDAWRNLVAREIENLYRRAFRPLRETVPAQAESVVFADGAELLASLAKDWCEGLLAENWWWRSLFPNLYLTETVARIWMETAEFAPSAMQILAAQEKAVEFVGRLQPAEVDGLLRRIVVIFGLDNLEKAVFEPIGKNAASAAVPADRPAEQKAEKSFSGQFETRAPWSELAPETRLFSGSFGRQSLLGIVLMLARAPRQARSAEFARRVKAFRLEFAGAAARRDKSEDALESEKNKKRRAPARKTNAAEKSKSAPAPPEAGSGAKKSFGKKTIEFLTDASRAAEKEAGSGEIAGDSKPKISLPAERVEKDSKKIVFEDAPREEKSGRRKSETGTASGRALKDDLSPRPPAKDAAKSENEFFADGETDFEFAVETRFGGVFYLLNLGLYLNLYRDFTESGETEIELNLWDFVALLALEFAGSEIKRDAVWQLLEWLSGRENGEEPGGDFDAPDEWRLAPDWLKTFQTSEKWLWSRAGGRLVVRHPAGFKIIDVRLFDDAEARLASELKPYGKSLFETAEIDSADFSERFSPAENWLKNLSGFAEARLMQALNLAEREQIGRLLFERRARVSVTATRLDITFSLADLPFEVRLSGLDRNPSWIPAAGRFVNFHFI